MVDARRGSIRLTTALDEQGEFQTGRFGGSRFQIRQGHKAAGMTSLTLRGGDFGRCPARSSALAHSSVVPRENPTTRRVVRRLWARDRGGRFRTYGNNSVATARGTAWTTEDRCDGTRHPRARGRRRGEGPPHAAGPCSCAPAARTSRSDEARSGVPRLRMLLTAGVLAAAVAVRRDVHGRAGPDRERRARPRSSRSARRRPPDDVAVVAIDDVTFYELERQWPFPRSMMGKAVDRLAELGAREIVIDIQYTEPSTEREDGALYDAIARAGGAVLATSETRRPRPHARARRRREPRADRRPRRRQQPARRGAAA